MHLPTDGTPLPGYELAQADLERGHRTVAAAAEAQLAGLAVQLATRTPKRPTTTPRLARAPPASRSVSAAKSEATSPPRPPASNRLRRRARRECRAGAAAAAAADLSDRRRRKPAGARPARAAAPIQLASLSPNEIVNMRGLWDDTGDAVAASPPAAETNALSVSSARRTAARLPRAAT